MKKAIVCAVMLAMTSGVAIADLGKAQKAGQFGKWLVLQDTDKMTDKISCTGVQGDKYEIQLTERALYIRVSGGVESVTLRFDQKPARPLRLATDMEKRIRAVIIEGADFAEALASSRILMEVNTLVSGIKTLEIDSSGIEQAAQLISAGCPIQSKPATTAAPEPAAATTEGGICTPDLQDRMRKAGVKAAQINKICSD